MTYYIQTSEGKILKGKANTWNEVWRGLPFGAKLLNLLCAILINLMLISKLPNLCKALKIQKALANGIFLWYNRHIR